VGSHSKPFQNATKANKALIVVAALIVSVECPVAAQSEWGGIGGGWKSLGADADDEPVVSSKNVVARTSALPTSALSNSQQGGTNRALTRSIASRYANHEIVRAAGIDPREFVIFFETMIHAESAYNDRAYSSAGAIGLAQLMPGTAKLLGVDPHDRTQNLDGGARYLIAQINEFGTLSLAVAAYNAGPGAVRSYGGVPPYRETERHVAKVMSNYERQWRRVSSQE